ncbi:hypothetical protein RJ639_032811 [Escallonia herrerae]|uniref:Uncharacterized protein n=2 Tax=Escallonia herrerae TaxID=1293975 RepID=A0AA89BJT6_9ASTE|nr:hypothetical protein RJ639_032811 [Escallonia herrerae]
MGVMSRRVLPACSNLCIFCPSMRARSRQPVKRYKKLLSDIFPRSQDAEPNDRKIGKLCEYASKNPLRIPKITEYLEQRFYKDLRNEHFGSVKVVLLVYRKLLSSCKQQMSLFASSLLGIARTLLEQTRNDKMQMLGCSTLVDFINSQVRFMGEQSHISMDFDNTFDTENHWSLEKGLAFSVLKFLQSLLEESGYTWNPGGNSHQLLSFLVKHLEHKNVVKQPAIQISIVNVARQLAQNINQQTSAVIIGAISDLVKHLRKCIQYSAEASSDGLDKCNTDLQSALENCISQLANKASTYFLFSFCELHL